MNSICCATCSVCRWLGALLTPHFECFCPPEGQKLPKHDKNMSGSRHSLFECVYQIWGIYIIFKGMYADKWLWPTLGQSVQIGMKLELDVTPPTRCICQVSNWYLKTYKKKVRKTFRWLGAVVTPPLKCFLSTRGPKIAQAWQKSVGVKTLTIWVFVPNLRPLNNS